MKRLVTAICVSLIGASLGQAQGPATSKPDAPANIPVVPQETRPANVPGSPAPEVWMQEPSSCGITSGCDQRYMYSRFTAGFEYLLWSFPRDHTSMVAATDGTLNNRLLATAGDQDLDRRLWSGGRITLGYWWYEPHNLLPNAGIPVRGAEAKFFVLGQQSTSVEDYTSPVIVRPFFDLNNRVNSGVVIAAPGFATGGIDANAKMSMWGAEANVWQSVKRGDEYSIVTMAVMGGVRYLELDPTLTINALSVYNQNLANFPSYIPFAGNTVQSIEEFSTRNRFFGGQVGVSARFYADKVAFDSAVKLALGGNNEQLRIEGQQIRTLANGTQIVSPGSLLALQSNIGTHNRTIFSQVPEITAGITCPVLPNMTFRTEFMAMYWSNVLRAHEQIDRTIDVTQIPNYPPAAGVTPTGIARPGVKFEQSDIWVLGVNFGVEFKW